MLKIEPTFIKDLFVLHGTSIKMNEEFSIDSSQPTNLPPRAYPLKPYTSIPLPPLQWEPCEAFIFNTLLSPKERSFPVPRVRFGTWALIFARIPLPGSSGLEPSSLQRMESAWLFPKALAMLSSRLNPTQPSCTWSPLYMPRITNQALCMTIPF